MARSYVLTHYCQRILSDSILNKCYAVSYLHIVQFAIEKIISLSKKYHDIFTNQTKYEKNADN